MIITINGKKQALKYLLGIDTNVRNLQLRLFANSAALTEESVASDLTELTSGNGYAAIPLTASSWVLAVSGARYTYPRQTWTFTGPKGNIYGYYVTDSTGVLMWAETFPSGPYNVQNNGDVINVDLQLSIA